MTVDTAHPCRLVGTTAVVTGVSRGIGRAIAAGLAAAGADVVGAYRSDAAGAAEAAADVEATGRRALFLQADTGDPATAARLADAAEAEFGGIDIWVNNAARLMVKPILETSDDDWHGLLAANLHGYFYGSREALRRMRDRGRGRIINITSAADILVVADLGAYIAAKGAIVALTKVLALEAAPFGVTVNALAPGAIDTPLNQSAYTPEVRRIYEQRIGLGRIGTAEEVADAVVFVAGHASRYMTGHELVVDGGLVINGTVGHARDEG
jgi:3-oxoacyl-[acyl-carrier protein] reductase